MLAKYYQNIVPFLFPILDVSNIWRLLCALWLGSGAYSSIAVQHVLHTFNEGILDSSKLGLDHDMLLQCLKRPYIVLHYCPLYKKNLWFTFDFQKMEKSPIKNRMQKLKLQNHFNLFWKEQRFLAADRDCTHTDDQRHHVVQQCEI